MEKFISSHRNPRIKFARSLNHRKNRKKTGLFLVEGIKHTGEVADSSFEIETLLYSEDLLKSDYANKLVEKLSGEGIDCFNKDCRLDA